MHKLSTACASIYPLVAQKMRAPRRLAHHDKKSPSATLLERVDTILVRTMPERLGSYIRIHRKQSGLSQIELARVLGYDRHGPVGRHERLRSVPPLLMAVGYSVVFRRPVSELFAGLYEAVERAVETRLSTLELELRESATTTPGRAILAKKLKWLSDRRKPGRDGLGLTKTLFKT